MRAERFWSYPAGGGGPRNAVEGVRPIRSVGGKAPFTTLRVVPLPQEGRTK